MNKKTEMMVSLGVGAMIGTVIGGVLYCTTKKNPKLDIKSLSCID